MYVHLIEISGSVAFLMFAVMVARPAAQSVLGEAWAARNFGYTVHESYRLSRDGSTGGRISMPLVARLLSRLDQLNRHARGGWVMRAIRTEPLDHPVGRDPRFLLAWPSFRIRPVTQTAIVAQAAFQFAAALSRMAAATGSARPDPGPRHGGNGGRTFIDPGFPHPGGSGSPSPRPEPEFPVGTIQYDDIPETMHLEPLPSLPEPSLFIDEPETATDYPRALADGPVSLFPDASDDWNSILRAARA